MKLFLSFFYILLLVFLFFFLIYSISFLFSMSGFVKGSPFECGFLPMTSSGFSFSLPFFMVSLLFLLFDVEIVFICFYPFSYSFGWDQSIVMGFILFVMLFSTLYEWVSGVLSWF